MNSQIMDLETVTLNERISSLNDTEPDDKPIKQWNVPRVVYKELPAVCLAIGIVINIILIIYFVKSKRYVNPLFTILTCLAMMDTCVCIGGFIYAAVIFPFMITPGSRLVCEPSIFITIFGMYGSEYILLFFTCVRLYQVVSPFRARSLITMKLMTKCCLGIALIIGSCAIYYATLYHTVTMVVDGNEVIVCLYTGDRRRRAFTVLILETAIPCVGIVGLHMAKYSGYMTSNKFPDVQQDRKNPDGAAIAIVIVIFYICWIPPAVYMIVNNFGTEGFNNLMDNAYLVLMHVKFTNSIVNPIVYVLAMKSIRDDIINLFGFTPKNK